MPPNSELMPNQTSNDAVEITALSKVIKEAVTPFAESQKYVAQEVTQQTEIISTAKLKQFLGYLRTQFLHHHPSQKFA